MASGVVAPALLGAVDDVGDRLGAVGEGGVAGVEAHPQRRERRVPHDVVAVIDGQERVSGQLGIDGRLVMAEMYRRPELEEDVAVAGHEPVRDVDHVVAVGEHDALLEDRAVDVVAPPGEAVDEAELREVGVTVEFQPGFGLLGPQLHSAPAGEAQLLGQVGEHHHPPQRVGEGGHQPAVVPAGHEPRHGSRGVAADPVGHQPFPLDLLGGIGLGRRRDRADHRAGHGEPRNRAEWAARVHGPRTSDSGVPLPP